MSSLFPSIKIDLRCSVGYYGSSRQGWWNRWGFGALAPSLFEEVLNEVPYHQPCNVYQCLSQQCLHFKAFYGTFEKPGIDGTSKPLLGPLSVWLAVKNFT